MDAYTANNGYLTTETDPSVNAAAKANLSTCVAGDVLLLGSSGWECSTNVSGTGKWSDGATSGDIVYTGGNVGIGTSSPAANLEISSGNDGDAVLRIEANEDNNSQREDHNPSIQFFQDGASSGMRMGLTEKAGDSYNSFAFFHTAGGTESETPALVIEQDNTIQMQGKVGIGTTDPGAKLEVASTNSSQLTLRNTDTTNGTAGYGNLWADNNGLWLQGHGDTSGQSIILNPNGGNVGIATLSPDAKLDVEGSLQADTFTGEAKIYTHAQEITTNSAVDVEHFAMYIDQGVYSTIALVNQGDGTDGAGTVDTYQFDYSGSGLTVGNFQPKQTLTGFTNPNDVEVFQEYEYDEEGNIVTATETYLIVGDASDAAILHQWDGTNFVAITGKEIPTTGHTDTEVFYIDGQQVIALAQSEEIDIRTWDGSEYSIKDLIELDGVQKLHFFEADLNADDATEGYLAAATENGLSIYQWQEGQGYYVFSEFATLDAPSAQNAHYFEVDDRQFLMVPSDGNVDSPLYEWNGTEFEVTQTLDTYSGSVAATNFEFEGTEYLVLTAKGNSDYDYIRFFYYEDDIFKIRQSLSSKNIATGVNGLMDIETWFFGGEHRLMLAEATPSRVLRIEEYNNVIIGINNPEQSKEHNLYVPGGDILMSMYQPDNIDGISYDDTDNVYSFHADQEHRPGWDSPGAAISAKNGYFGGRYVGSANTSGNYYLGNFDWTDYVGNHSNYNYSEEHQGVIISNSMNVFFGNRTPIDPEATYRIRVRAKKLSGDGTFYAGVQTLDEHFVELRTDGAKTYNYGVASNQVINVGETKTFEGFFKGYGVVDAADHNKFDPGGKYFNAMIIANYHTTDSESETVIESIEIEKVDTIIADKDGNVGIGTTNPERKLLVKDDNPLPIQIEYDGTLGNGSSVGIAFLDNADGSSAVNSQIRAIRESDYESGLAFFTKNLTTGTQESFRVYGNGNAWLKGELTENSDSRYKKDIRTLPSALQNILSLRGVSYYWKDGSDTSQHIGVISQEVEKVYPQLVRTDEDGYKSVAYSHLVSPLIEAVKELHALYQGHADRIALLEAKLQERDAALEAQNAELETQNAHQDERIAHQDELIVQLEVRLAALEAAQ